MLQLSVEYSEAISPFSVSPAGCFPSNIKKCTGLLYPLGLHRLSCSHWGEIQWKLIEWCSLPLSHAPFTIPVILQDIRSQTCSSNLSALL